MPQRKKISDEEILRAIRDGEKPYTTATRLAEEFPISRQGISYRLKSLSEDGRLQQDKISGSGVLYLLPDASS